VRTNEIAKIVKSDLRYSQEWRDSLKFIDMTYSEFIDFILYRNDNAYMSEKIDGELNSLIYEKGKEPYFITKSGVIRKRDYPVLKEYKDIFDQRKDINDIVTIGELKGVDENGNQLPFNKSQSTIQTGDVTKVRHFPFDIYRFNGEKTRFVFSYIDDIFNNKNFINTPRWIYGGVEFFKKLWERIVVKEHGEGVVSYFPSEPNIVYRIKHVMTADVVVISAGNETGKAWIKGQIGYLKLALLDENNNLLLTSKVGTGFMKKDRIELFDYFNKNCIERKDGDLWIPPVLITEVKYRRHRFNKVPLLKYNNGKYIELGEGDGVTMDQTSFIRFRNDKRINFKDLSKYQFPLS